MSASLDSSFAQSNDNAQNNPGTTSSNFTSVSNYLNISSGKVSYSVPISDKFGIGLSYSTNAVAGVDEPNSTVSTGLVGIGWSFNIPKIVVDHKNTGTRIDDEFYLVEAGGLNQLYCIDKTAEYNEFVGSGVSNTRIYYYFQDERWDLIRDDGTIYSYGGKSNECNSIVNWIKWGNWMGDSPVVEDQNGNIVQEHLAISWYLSEVKSVFNNTVEYRYKQDLEQVCNSNSSDPRYSCNDALSYTKGIYLSEILNEGERMLFNYSMKDTIEYFDRNTSQPEPDAYQEWILKEYLESIETYNKHDNLIGRQQFLYDSLNETGYRKRILTGIQNIDHNGDQDYPMTFEYYNSGGKKGYLEKIKYPTGKTVSYEYDSIEIAVNESQISTILSSPGEFYSQPLYKIFDNYMIVSWRNVHVSSTNDVIVDLYEWDSKWNKLGSITSFDNVLSNGNSDQIVYEDFKILTQDGFFGILHRENLKVFAKNHNQTSSWDLVVNKTLPWGYKQGPYELMAGDKYIAVGDKDGDVYIYTEGRWQEEYISSPENSDDYYFDYQHNFFVSNSENQLFNFYLIDEAKHWSVQTKELDVDGQPICTSNGCYYTQHNTGNQLLMKWNESFDLDSLKVCTVPNNPSGTALTAVRGINNLITLEETQIQIQPYAVGALVDYYDTTYVWNWDSSYKHWLDHKPKRFYRRVVKKGEEPGWTEEVITKHQRVITVTRYSQNQQTAYKYVSFDANTQSWTEIHLQGSDIEPINDETLNIGTNETFIANSKVYYFTGNDDISVIGDLWDILQDEAIAAGINSFTDFQFDTKTSYAGDGYYVLYSSFTETSYVLFVDKEGLKKKVSLPGVKTAWNGTSGGYFLAHSSNQSLSDATSLLIYDINDYDIKASILDCPVKRITYNDGFQEQHTRFDYDINNPILTGSPQYSRVTVSNEGASPDGATRYGSTEYQFYNGNNKYSFPYQVNQLNGGDAANLPIFKGTPIRTIVRNNMGDTVSLSETSYKTFKREYFCNGGMKIGEGIATKPVAEVIFENGIWSKTYSNYLDDTRLSETISFSTSAEGDSLLYKVSYIYSDSIYSGMYDLNITSTPIQTTTAVYYPVLDSTVITDIQATKWKDWGSNMWAPYEKWTWLGNHDESTFSSWGQFEEPSGLWQQDYHVDAVDSKGQILQSTSNSGVVTSKVYKDNMEVASYLNASLEDVFFDNFDHLDGNDIDSTWIHSNHISITSEGKLILSSMGNSNFCTIPYDASSNFIMEFEGRLEKGNSGSSWGGVQILKENSLDNYAQSGYTLRYYPDGNIDIYSAIDGVVASTSTELEFEDWHHFIISFSDNTLQLFIDGQKYLACNSNSSLGLLAGFTGNDIDLYLDNVNIYPSQAVSMSIGYHPKYGMMTSQTKANGVTEYYLYDNELDPIGQLNSSRKPNNTYYYSASVDYNNGVFLSSSPDKSISTEIMGSEGFFDDFSFNRPQWSNLNAGSCNNWSIEDGGLQFHRNTSQCASNELKNYKSKINIQDRVAIRFDVRANLSSVNPILGIAIGDANWDGENLGSGYDLKLNLQVEDSWVNYLLVANYETDSYNLFKNGQIISEKLPLDFLGEEFFQVTFYDETSGDNSSFTVDNFFVYDNFISEAVYLDTEGKTRQVQKEDGGGDVIVGQPIYDELGRDVITTRPTKFEGIDNQCYLCYKPNFAIYDWTNHSLSGEIVTQNPLDSGYSYTRKVFDNSPQSQIIEESIRFGKQNRIGSEFSTKYKVGAVSEFPELINEFGSNNYLATSVTLLDSLTKFQVSDLKGNVIMTKMGKVSTGSLFASANPSDQYLTTTYKYDVKGNLIEEVPPSYHSSTVSQQVNKNELITTNRFDHEGNLCGSKSCDSGTLTNIFDSSGKLRFVLDDAGLVGEDFFELGVCKQQYISYYKYDTFGNTVETGFYPHTWDEEFLRVQAEIPDWPNSSNLNVTLLQNFDGDDIVGFESLQSAVTSEISFTGDHSLKVIDQSLEFYLPINIESSIELSSMVAGTGSGTIEIYYLTSDSSFINNYEIKSIDAGNGWSEIAFDPLIASNNGVLRVVLKSISGPVYFDEIRVDYNTLYPLETWYQRHSYYGLDGNYYERGLLKETITNNGFGDEEDLTISKFRYDDRGNVIAKSQKIGSEQINFTTIHYEYNNSNMLTRTYITDDANWNELYYLDQDSSVLTQETVQYVADKAIIATDGFEITSGATVDLIPDGNGEPVPLEYLPNITYHYDDVGRLTSIGNDSIQNYYVTYTYDKHGNISTESLNQSTIQSDFQYDHLGRLNHIYYHNYFSEDISYNSRELISSTSYVINQALASKTPYSSDENFRHEYVYDEIGRLISVWSDLGIEYQLQADYDANGNFVSSSSNNVPKSFKYYPGTNRVQNVSGDNSNTFEYDSKGNIVNNYVKGLSISYNKTTNLTTQLKTDSLDVRFKYGSNKTKVLRKSSDGGRTSYLNDLDGSTLLEKYNSWSQKHSKFVVTGPNGIVAIVIDGNPFFYLRDHLGSPLAIVDSNGEPVLIMYYGPHGHTNEKYIVADASSNFSAQYSGKENEKFLGLYNYGSRMYDPDIGLFYSVDPQGQFDSPYMAMGGNPIIMVDPDGEFAVLLGLGIGLVTGYFGGKAAGLKGINLLGYVLASGIIGGLSGYVGKYVGVKLLAKSISGIYVGAAAGSSAGFVGGSLGAALNGKNPLEGALNGAISGAVGGVVGTKISGAFGAFMGGASASSTSALISGAETEDVLLAGLTGGAFSLATYSAVAKIRGNNRMQNVAFDNMSMKEKLQASKAIQRQIVTGKEHGFVKFKDDNFVTSLQKSKGEAHYKWVPKMDKLTGKIDPYRQFTHRTYDMIDMQWLHKMSFVFYDLHTHNTSGVGKFSLHKGDLQSYRFWKTPHNFMINRDNIHYMEYVFGKVHNKYMKVYDIQKYLIRSPLGF